MVLVDATDRLKAQSRVEVLTRQVKELLVEKDFYELKGAELEAFAAAVSHDLRGPLRAIASFSELLAESQRDRLDAAGQLFLNRVRSSALQMGHMVEDYLSFLKSNREQTLRLVELDLEGLAQTVFADLACVPGQKPAAFICATLPPVWGDAAMLRQVLVNLLGNALKYSSKCEQPLVEVGAIADNEAGEGLHTYFVRDNGAGLDMASATKLFEPFQRFHSAAEFPGTGVGLAIVKRILERHGGRIWAQSQSGAGATFFFSLPAKAPSVTAPLP